MKHPILIALSLIPFLGIAQNTGYQLTVRLNGLKPQAKAWLVYEYGMTDQKTLDSASAKNGAFTFHGTTRDPLVKANLVFERTGGHLPNYNTHPDARVIYLEKGHILFTASDSILTAKVARGPVNKDYTAYDAAVLSRARLAGDQLNAAYKAAGPQQQQDSAFRAQLFAEFKVGMKIKDSLSIAWIQDHPGSYISLTVLREIAGKDIDVSRIEPLFDGLSDSLRTTEQGRDFADAINSARFTSIGSVAPDFTENDTSDQPVRLSDFKGKYVLLDFWASWCRPCRAENPNMVKAYNTYKDKNFIVLSVSLDGAGATANWMAAVRQDGLPWTQVNEPAGFKQDKGIGKLYDIHFIPQNFLVGPDGKVLFIDQRGDELQQKLAALFSH